MVLANLTHLIQNNVASIYVTHLSLIRNTSCLVFDLKIFVLLEMSTVILFFIVSVKLLYLVCVKVLVCLPPVQLQVENLWLITLEMY